MNESLNWIVKLADHGVVEMDRKGFVEVVELDPSTSLKCMRLSAVRKLSSKRSERNGNRLVLLLVYYDGEAWSELQLAFVTIEPVDIDVTDHTEIFLWSCD